MLFPPAFDIAEHLRNGTTGKSYFDNVVLPDERRFLLSNSMDHLQGLDANSVAGDRVVIIANDQPTVDWEEWQGVWTKHQGET
jgi:hypothetical protein